ncbi:MAG TPA: phosphatase domain-containing protein, partial [Polyangiaceae bacterium]
MRLEWRTALVGIDAFVARSQREVRRAFGRHVAVRLMPYRGWIAPHKAVVIARTIDADLEWDRRLQHSARLARVLYERFATVIRSGVCVRVNWQGLTTLQTSDDAGFIDVQFPVEGRNFEQTTAAGLAVADTSAAALPLPDTVAGPASADVLAFDPNAPFGIISDIDDTVLETELTNLWKRGLQLVYSEQRMRLPFDGIAALYQAFAAHQKPVFYVSNAPWNLYPHVAELLDHHQIPKGPLLLRDSAFSERITPHPELGRIV